MVKTIYLVAGERLIEGVAHFGGLYANVGQTERTVSERLKDEDYRRKNSGGDWKVLKTWKVPSEISDSVLHKILKSNKYAGKVVWKKSSNTEEFQFIGDDGNGSVAIPIIQEELEKLSVFIELPAIKAANKDLIQANKELTKSNQILEINYKSVSKKLRDLVGGDILDENARLLGELEEEREEKDALAAMLEQQKEEHDAHWNKRKRVLTLAGGEQRVEYLEPEEEKLKQKISLLSEDIIDRRLKSRYTIFAFCIALFFTWRSGSNANEELETLAIVNEQQVEKMKLQLEKAAHIASCQSEIIDKIGEVPALNNATSEQICRAKAAGFPDSLYNTWDEDDWNAIFPEAKKKAVKKKAKPKKKAVKKKATPEELTQCKFFTKEGKNLICSSNGKYYKIYGSGSLSCTSSSYAGKMVKILKIGGERWYTIVAPYCVGEEQNKVIKVENM